MFNDSRLVMSVCGLLPLTPCIGPPLSDVSCLDSVVFGSDIQVSSSLSCVTLWAVHACYLVDGIHRLVDNLLVFQPEQVGAGLKAREMPCFLNTSASDNPFTYGKTANPCVSFCSRLVFSFSNFFFFLLFPYFCLSSTDLKVILGYPQCLRASLVMSFSLLLTGLV